MQQAQREADARSLEAQRLQAAEGENRQRLERAVASYLEIIQAIAQGDLSRRIVVEHDGALGALGQALNQTLASTQQAERAARDLNALAQSLQRHLAIYHLG